MSFIFPGAAARDRRLQTSATLAKTREAVRMLNKLAVDQLAAARGFTDPNLSPEGLAKHRAEAEAAVRRDLANAIATVKAQLKSAVDDATKDAAAQRPGINWNDPASVQRTQVKWDQARMRLEAGMSLRAVLAGADLDTAIAIREWAPAWLDATQHQAPNLAEGRIGYTPADYEPFLRNVDRRIAEVAGGHVAEALTVAEESQAAAAWAGQHLGHLDAVAQGVPQAHGAIGAAIAADFAEQQIRAGWPATGDETPEGSA